MDDDYSGDGISCINDYLMHYGTPRHSGRYPWGSGDSPYQHTGDFYTHINELRAKGMNDTDIAAGEGLSTTQMRALYSIDKDNRRRDMVSFVKSLTKDGLNHVEIGKQLGEKYFNGKEVGESTVRSLLNGDSEARMNIANKTADNLKKLCDERGMIDVGTGTERELGISATKMTDALTILELNGYEVYGARVPQANNKGKMTTIKVLCPPGTEHSAIYNYDQIHQITDYTSPDDGDTFVPSFRYPESMDSKRLMIRYAEDGGKAKDGVVEIRRGVKDLSLGESNYSQVRILVDKTHYIKGMAVYSDGSDMPDGVDVIFNTNKTKDVAKLDVLKSIDKNIKKDPDNPFGSAIKEEGGQSTYIGDDGKEHLSLINKRSNEGDWDEWSKELPSQFLSKQPKQLINRQLKLAEENKQSEFDEIESVSNPTVKRQMLLEFADKCDKAAVDLKAAPLPGQKYQVILPLTTIKDDEVYAPNFKDGSQVALIRYPHAGTFEIPILTVNNRNKEGKEVLTPNARDAVGINSKVAERLSGADFDGDTVMVIPLSEKVKVESTDPLKGLIGFDPTSSYGPDPKQTYKDDAGETHYVRNGHEYKLMTNTQNEMGKISNLITDMTLRGATDEEKVRAVKHSMVVIDAEKHHLDYKQSYIDNGIGALHTKYQSQTEPNGKTHEGAATLISRAKSEVRVPERKEGAYVAKDTGHILTLVDPENKLYLDEKTGQVYSQKEKKTMTIDPKTGKKLYRETNKIYSDVNYVDSQGNKKHARVFTQDGKMVYKNDEGKVVQVKDGQKIIDHIATTTSTKMMEADDARDLISVGDTPQEELYADYANKMKSLANEARKESLTIKDKSYSASSNKTYLEQVNSLNYKLDEALRNAPRERQAQMITASAMKAIKQENPDLSDEEAMKMSQRILQKARARTNAKRKAVYIDDKEWEAIQAGAISPTMLKLILANVDDERLKQIAMPRDTVSLSKGQVSRLKSLSTMGYTNAEIADALHISSSTVVKYLSGKEN
jgi:hypothetical protein